MAITPIRFVACIHLAVGSVGLLAGTALCVALFIDTSPESVATFQFVGPAFLMAAVLYLGPAFVGGLGLLVGKSWARIPLAIISVLLVPMLPAGTALGVFGLWALANQKKTCVAEYAAAPATKSSNRQTVVPASPALRDPVVRIKGGKHESAERIAYRQDPNSLATCAHLQPIERAMRAAGLDLRLDSRLVVKALCAIAEAEFLRRCRPGPTVSFKLHADHGRSYEDPPIASLTCDACRSLIYVVHPLEAVATTPRFPGSAGFS